MAKVLDAIDDATTYAMELSKRGHGVRVDLIEALYTKLEGKLFFLAANTNPQWKAVFTEQIKAIHSPKLRDDALDEILDGLVRCKTWWIKGQVK